MVMVLIMVRLVVAHLPPFVAVVVVVAVGVVVVGVVVVFAATTIGHKTAITQ